MVFDILFFMCIIALPLAWAERAKACIRIKNSEEDDK